MRCRTNCLILILVLLVALLMGCAPKPTPAATTTTVLPTTTAAVIKTTAAPVTTTAGQAATTPAATTTKAVTTVAPTTTEAPPDLKGVSISIGLPGEYEVTNEEVIKGFQTKFPDLEVKLSAEPWDDWTSKILAQVAGGQAPTVWFQENAVILGYGKTGAATDLAPYIKKDLDTDKYPPVLFAAKDGDKVWGVPHDINNVGLVYNKKIFADAGVPVPTVDWTYDDLIKTAAKLVKKGADGNTEIFGYVATSNITTGWFPWAKSFGGMVLDEKKEKAVFDAKVLQGFKAAIKLYEDGVSPTYDQLQQMGRNAPTAFGNGKVAMYFAQYDELPSLLNKNFPELDYDVVMMPKSMDGVRRVPTVVNSWLIFSRASDKQKTAGWEFLKYYLSPEAQNMIGKSGLAMPLLGEAQKTFVSAVKKPANVKAFTDSLEFGISLDENAAWNTWRRSAQPLISDMYGRNATPEDTIASLIPAVQKAIDIWVTENVK